MTPNTKEIALGQIRQAWKAESSDLSPTNRMGCDVIQEMWNLLN